MMAVEDRAVREGYKMSQFGDIPVEWEVLKLSDVISEFLVPMRDKPKNFDGDIPWCRIEDIEGKYLNDSQSDQRVTIETIKELRMKIIPKGSLICSCSARLGVCAITTRELTTNQTFIALVPTKDVSNEFMYYLMTSYAPRLQAMSSGTTIAYLSRKQFEDFQIVVPSIDEQQKIAEILSIVDEQIKNTDQLIEKTKELKKGLMQQLLTKGIGHTEFKKTELGEIPVEWEVKNFDEVMILQRGFDLPIQSRIKGNIPIVSANGVSGSHIEAKVKAPGIVTGRSGTIGKVHYIEEDFWALNTSLYVKEMYANEPKFLYYFLMNFGLEKFSTGTGVPTLNRNDVHKVRIAIPQSVKEQKKIAEIISSIDEQIEYYQQEKDKYTDLKKGLMQQLLTGKIRVKV